MNHTEQKSRVKELKAKLAEQEEVTTCQATYSPEDNKLRLYPESYLEEDELELVKLMGYSWAPKQKLFVAPRWTPGKEDIALIFAPEGIELEGMTLLERAQEKEARFNGYAESSELKSNERYSTAKKAIRGIEFGQPILVGHHSEARHRRDAKKHDDNMQKSWELQKRANRWASRASSSVSHANHKNSDRCRANRIKTLFTDLRYQLAELSVLNDQQPKAKEYRQRFANHILNRIKYEQGEQGATELFKGKLTAGDVQTFLRHHGSIKPKAKATSESWTITADYLPEHLNLSQEITDENLKELMQSWAYSIAIKKAAPKKPPILNFKSDELEVKSHSIFEDFTKVTQVEMTKERYKNHSSSSIRISKCGEYRVRTVFVHTEKGCYVAAVFLTDSKAHKAPSA